MLKRVLKRIGLVGVALLVSFLLAEVGLRVAGVSAPRRSRRDDNLGFAYRPSITWHQATEGEATIVINSEGYRDREWELEKPADTVRIVVLGDSYAEAAQIAVEERLSAVLERELEEKSAFGGKNVEVMNFGMSGYGTAQELMVWRHRAKKYKPDIVILCFLPTNDVRNNYEPLQRDDGRPYFVFDDQGQLVLDASFRTAPGHVKSGLERAAYVLIDNSRVLQLVYRARRLMLERRHAQQIRAGGFQGHEGQELGLDDMIYVDPQDPKWQEAWRATEALMVTMRDEVKAADARFLVVTLTGAIQVSPDKKKRDAFAARLGVEHLFYADDRTAALGKRAGLEVLNLARDYQAEADRAGTYFHGFENTGQGRGHWNANGHGRCGKLLAARILEWDGLDR